MKIVEQQKMTIKLDSRMTIELSCDGDEFELKLIEPDSGYGMNEKIGKVLTAKVAKNEVLEFVNAIRRVASPILEAVPKVVYGAATVIAKDDAAEHWRRVSAAYADLSDDERAELKAEQESMGI